MSSTKVAIISDTHGVIHPEILDAIKSCDQIIHSGDICGAHILQQLEEICPNVTAVIGNNDVESLWPENEADIVNALPAIAEIKLPGGIVAIEHGHKHGIHQPDHASLRDMHSHARVIIYGHTHTMLIDDDTSPWVINPGAAGATRTRGGASCLILTASTEAEWDIQMLRFDDEVAA